MTVETAPAPPSRNPTDDDSLVGLLSVVLRKYGQRLEDMLPARIIAYDRTKNLAQVQPIMSVVTTDAKTVKRSPVLSVPVVQVGGGGFMLNFPIKPGDLGFIKANDRDISLFKQSWSETVPNTARTHSFEDAVFFPAALNNFTIAASDADKLVLQALDGSIRLSMADNRACITDQPAYTQNDNAVLDVQSTTKAFKIPRMTRTQRNAIPSPTGGFMVYVTDAPEGFSLYTGGAGWSNP